MIGERLKEERKRLGLNQDAFAGLAGVSRRAYAEWEAGNTSPTAAQLAALSEEGVDVLYIVTGQRSVAAVPVANRREYALLDNYRACEEEDKRAIERVALSAARTEPVARTAPKIHVETNKGQVVEGGLTQEGPVIFGGKYKERK